MNIAAGSVTKAIRRDLHRRIVQHWQSLDDERRQSIYDSAKSGAKHKPELQKRYGKFTGLYLAIVRAWKLHSGDGVQPITEPADETTLEGYLDKPLPCLRCFHYHRRRDALVWNNIAIGIRCLTSSERHRMRIQDDEVQAEGYRQGSHDEPSGFPEMHDRVRGMS